MYTQLVPAAGLFEGSLVGKLIVGGLVVGSVVSDTGRIITEFVLVGPGLLPDVGTTKLTCGEEITLDYKSMLCM